MRPKDIVEIVADSPGSLLATMEVVEPFIARVPPHGRITPCRFVHPPFAAETGHVFEAETGEEIR